MLLNDHKMTSKIALAQKMDPVNPRIHPFFRDSTVLLPIDSFPGSVEFTQESRDTGIRLHQPPFRLPPFLSKQSWMASQLQACPVSGCCGSTIEVGVKTYAACLMAGRLLSKPSLANTAMPKHSDLLPYKISPRNVRHLHNIGLQCGFLAPDRQTAAFQTLSGCMSPQEMCIGHIAAEKLARNKRPAEQPDAGPSKLSESLPAVPAPVAPRRVRCHGARQDHDDRHPQPTLAGESPAAGGDTDSRLLGEHSGTAAGRRGLGCDPLFVLPGPGMAPETTRIAVANLLG